MSILSIFSPYDDVKMPICQLKYGCAEQTYFPVTDVGTAEILILIVADSGS